MFSTIMRLPDSVMVQGEGGRASLVNSGACFSGRGVQVRLKLAGGGVSLSLDAPSAPLCYIRIRWNQVFPEGTFCLGDHWERGYGDLEWRGMVAHRLLPWYCVVRKEGACAGYGVKVRPGSICFWQVDPKGLTLWLDVRNGGGGVLLGDRTLALATVVCALSDGDESAFRFTKRFCSMMCTDPVLPKFPVYGGNNWYYAYGDSSQEKILEDSKKIAALASGNKNRPVMVIDDGWQEAHGGSYNGGPWNGGNRKFPDMPSLAGRMKSIGTRPGIWIRLLEDRDAAIPDGWRLSRDKTHLDPTAPGVKNRLAADIRRLRAWGYEIIKHDFSTVDIFGNYGFSMGHALTNAGWHFADPSLTTAEIIVGLYRTIFEAAGDAVLIGCNCMGHLGAGLMHLYRAGDDTSGVSWERTRKMGVNTLAFRLPQHRTFFDVDADCVGLKGVIPWPLNREWLRLLSRSGTPLFVSVEPGKTGEEEERALAEAMRRAASQADIAEPLDWVTDTCPSRWLINGSEQKFDWYEQTGVSGFQV